MRLYEYNPRSDLSLTPVSDGRRPPNTDDPANSENNRADGHNPPSPGTLNQIQRRDTTDVWTTNRIPCLRLYFEEGRSARRITDKSAGGGQERTAHHRQICGRRAGAHGASRTNLQEEGRSARRITDKSAVRRTRRTTCWTGTTRRVPVLPKKLPIRHLPFPSNLRPGK
jgi:hypothetical protein